MRARHLDSVVAFGLVILCSATVWAEETPKIEPAKVAAIATDTSPVTPTPADVAREVIKLQEELGGSITRHLSEPRQLQPPLPRPMAQSPHNWRPVAESPVVVLRETAWQLEQAAHRLELLDLYDQADAVRETAAILREEARWRKEEAAKEKSAPTKPTHP
jgi:hypothetical protein